MAGDDSAGSCASVGCRQLGCRQLRRTGKAHEGHAAGRRAAAFCPLGFFFRPSRPAPLSAWCAEAGERVRRVPHVHLRHLPRPRQSGGAAQDPVCIARSPSARPAASPRAVRAAARFSSLTGSSSSPEQGTAHELLVRRGRVRRVLLRVRRTGRRVASGPQRPVAGRESIQRRRLLQGRGRVPRCRTAPPYTVSPPGRCAGSIRCRPGSHGPAPTGVVRVGCG